MATRAQRAAARRNIKKAIAKNRRKRGGRARRRRASPRRRRRASAQAAALLENRRPRRRRPARRRRRRSANASLLQNLKPLLENAARPARASSEDLAANPRRRRRRAKRRAPVRRRTRRRASKRRMRRNPATHVIFAENSWRGQSRRHAVAARKGARKRRNRGGRKRTKASRRRLQRRRPRRRSELAMLENPGMMENPSLLPNAIAGAYSRSNLMAYGTAAAGVAVGLLVADFLDRYVATRKPADATSGAVANNPWYGRDAAAAQRMRPDAWRLGTQAAGAVVALGLAYWTRGSRIVPWVLGGTAIGFGANLLKMLADWWLMPAVFKTKADNEASFANRMYPLEQATIQDTVTDIFANWDKTQALADGQQTTPIVASPLNPPGSSDVYTLGRGGNSASAAVSGNGRFFKQTGRLGNCPSCGGHNGCWSDCSTQCPDCPGYRPHKKCTYVVQAGDDLYSMAAQAGVDVNDVVALNAGMAWPPGAGTTVVLPYGMCMIADTRTSQPVPPGYLPFTPPIMTTPGNVPGYMPTQPLTPIIPGPYVPPIVAGVPQNGDGSVAQPQPASGNGAKPERLGIYTIGVGDD